MAWSVQLLDNRVQRELDALPRDVRAHYDYISKLLCDHGPADVGRPRVRYVDKGLWEMRMNGRDGIARSLYAVEAGELILVLRFFVKKTQKTPKREIEIALQRLKEWKSS